MADIETDTDAATWAARHPYLAGIVVFVTPILVIFLARWIFNDIIEVGRIDVAFLPSGTHSDPYQMPFIPSRVTSSLYYFGFALCGVMVFSVALVVFAAVIIFLAVSNLVLRVGFVLTLLVAFGFVAVDFSGGPQLANYVPAKIARILIDNTLDHLPSCSAEDSVRLARCANDGIGNTGNSLARIITMGFAVVLTAGLAYALAIAVLTGWAGKEPKERLQRIEGITLLAAMTFLLTIVAVHLLFQPGAEMITAAYAPDKAGNIPQLQNYSELRSAMTLYWATIFSLALGTAYFGAATFVQNQADQTINFGGIWNVVKALLTVLSPVIADWVLKVGDTFANVIGVSGS